MTLCWRPMLSVFVNGDQYALMAKASLGIADEWQKTLMEDCSGPRRDVGCILSSWRAHFLRCVCGLITDGRRGWHVENRLYAVQMGKKDCHWAGWQGYLGTASMPFRLTPSSFHAVNHGSRCAVLVSWEVYQFQFLKPLLLPLDGGISLRRLPGPMRVVRHGSLLSLLETTLAPGDPTSKLELHNTWVTPISPHRLSKPPSSPAIPPPPKHRGQSRRKS